MSEEPKNERKFPALSDLDWDSAIEEWERSTFVPAVARDLDGRTGAPLGPQQATAGTDVRSAALSDVDGDPLDQLPSLLRSEPPAARSRGGLGYLFRRAPDAPTMSRAVDVHVPLDDDDPATVMRREPSSIAGPRVLTPEEREHDPDQDTVVGRRSSGGISVSVEIAEPSPPSSTMTRAVSPLDVAQSALAGNQTGSEPATLLQPSLNASETRAEDLNSRLPSSEAVSSEPATTSGSTIQLASGPNDAALAASFDLLLSELQHVEDPAARARLLTMLSELAGLFGRSDLQKEHIREAAKLAGPGSLAHTLLRQLAQNDEERLTSLGAQADAATPEGRTHAAVLAAQAALRLGNRELRESYLRQAIAADPGDPRAHLERIVDALVVGEAPPRTKISSLAALDDAAVGLASLSGGSASASDGDGVVLDATFQRIDRARRAVAENRFEDACEVLTELEHSQGLGASALLAATVFAPDAAEREQLYARLLDRGFDAAAHGLAIVALRTERESSLVRALAWPTLTNADRAIVCELAGRASTPEALVPSHISTALWMRQSARATDDLNFDANLPSRLVGQPSSQALVALGLALATHAPPNTLLALAAAAGTAADPAVFEVCLRLGRYETVAEKLAQGALGTDAPAMLAAALVCELASLPNVARSLYDQVSEELSHPEPLARVLGELEPGSLERRLTQSASSLPAALQRALLRSEIATRLRDLNAEAAVELFEAALADAPELSIPAFMGERMSRLAGDETRALWFLRATQAGAADPTERIVSCVREVLLVAENDAERAAKLVETAHRTSPRDATLRDLYERLVETAPADRASWRSEQAESGTDAERLLLEASYDLEASADIDGAYALARRLEPQRERDALVDSVINRLEAASGHAESDRDRLLREMGAATDNLSRRAVLERIAAVDALDRKDLKSALAWHRALLAQYGPSVESLRFVEHTLITDGVIPELGAISLAVGEQLPSGTAERVAHAHVSAASLARNDGGFASSRAAVDVAFASDGSAPLWALRSRMNHARFTRDSQATLETVPRLLDAVTSRSDRISLLLRAGEAASRASDTNVAVRYFSEAAAEDSGDVVAWGFLAEAKSRQGDYVGAAEACESLAEATHVPQHRAFAWYEAACLWQGDANHIDRAPARAINAFEHVVELDLAFQDAFSRLSGLYAEAHMGRELANLLDRKLASVTSPTEHTRISVDRARALALAGDASRAKEELLVVLKSAPDHSLALSSLAEICIATSAFDEAERALLALSRATPEPREQAETYMRLGLLYARHLQNFARAETALKEVLRRAPSDEPALAELARVYRKMRDPERAAEVQRELIGATSEPAMRIERMLELANLFEDVALDARKAEQVYESARREFPSDLSLLEALVRFYERHEQSPAKNILLDRAASDVRRTIGLGEYPGTEFGLLAMVFRLRGKDDDAALIESAWAAVDGRPNVAPLCDVRGLDSRLDDVIAPERLVPALRALLQKTGDALDLALPLDVTSMEASDAPADRAVELRSLAASCGLPELRIRSSATLARICLPASSSPAEVLVGDALLEAAAPGLSLTSRARTFVWLRALKAVRAHASALTRTGPHEVSSVARAWLLALDPTLEAEEHKGSLGAARARIQAGLPIARAPDLPLLAREARGALGDDVAGLGALVTTWVERSALVATGDLGGALDAIAWGAGLERAPEAEPDRAEWIARMPKARDLVAFAVSDAYLEARAKMTAL